MHIYVLCVVIKVGYINKINYINYMKLKDRIENIKTLLKYCPYSTKDVMLYDETLADYLTIFQ